MVCLTLGGNLAPWQTQYKQHYFQKLDKDHGSCEWGGIPCSLANSIKNKFMKWIMICRPLESTIRSASSEDRAKSASWKAHTIGLPA